MKILVRLPNWLGDAVMATPVLESLKASYPDALFTLMGTPVALSLFEGDERVGRLVVDESKKAKSRLLWLYQKAKELGSFDMAITLQNSLLSALFLFFTGSKVRIGYAREFRSLFLTNAPKENKKIHQVLRYLELVRPFCAAVTEKLHISSNATPKNLCIINPGAAYGEAKRWEAVKFGEVAARLSKEYDIAIVGAPNEADIGAQVEETLKAHGVTNYQNLVGKTTMRELIDLIASAKLFITNDSGPMHIAAAFCVPTVAIFGSTDENETAAWGNPHYAVAKKDIDCRPCKKRSCPLKHHDCMRLIGTAEVLEAVKKLEESAALCG
ncbi:MAG: lipopolysaccharide heptosyltransferase II [Campylobacterales bacterium]|nr:lipopolysaccharide heptosyltransferase II [Campylobacterales bacterium]